jgi:hypothetical protein
MILPNKHLSSDRALLTVGAHVLALLQEPKTVSALWDVMRRQNQIRSRHGRLSYDWFILALDFLHMTDAIELADGLIKKKQP